MSMPSKPAPDRLPLCVAIAGAVVSLATYSVAGGFAGWSALAGAVLALVNLLVLRTIVLRVVSGDIHTKLPLLALIFVKMGVIMGLVYWVIAKHLVEPVAFTVGLSSLFVGLVTGSLFISRARTSAGVTSVPRSES